MKNKALEGNKNAEVDIDWKTVDKLLKIGAIGEEIAAVLGVSYDTLERHCKKEKGVPFAEYIKKGMSNFKISLRRAQQRAMQGIPKVKKITKIDPKTGKEYVDKEIERWISHPSVPMQIFLGKNYLDQSDKMEMKNEINVGRKETNNLTENQINKIKEIID